MLATFYGGIANIKVQNSLRGWRFGKDLFCGDKLSHVIEWSKVGVSTDLLKNWLELRQSYVAGNKRSRNSYLIAINKFGAFAHKDSWGFPNLKLPISVEGTVDYFLFEITYCQGLFYKLLYSLSGLYCQNKDSSSGSCSFWELWNNNSTRIHKISTEVGEVTRNWKPWKWC